MELTLFIIAILMLISSIFSGAETALLSVSKARLHQSALAGNNAAKTALQLVSNPEPMLTTILFFNTLVNIGSSSLTTALMITLFGPSGVAYATIAVSAIILIFGEALPKSFGTRFAEAITLKVAKPLKYLVFFCTPIIITVRYLTQAILWLTRLNGNQQNGFTEHDVRGAINLGLQHGAIHAREHRMLDAVLDLDDLTVADVMIHRSAIIAIDINTLPQDVPVTLGQLKHSRVPVYKGKPDNIIGFLFVRDYIAALGQVSTRHEIELRHHIRPAYYVPETTPLGYQLIEFLKNRKHLALIVDEYGDLQGLLTLEDILEEIVGEISDEHDPAMTEIQTTPDGIITLPGRFAVRDANRRFDWDLPDDNAVTMAGLMMDKLGHLPAQGESVVIDTLRLVVTAKRGHRIERITVSPSHKVA